MQPVAGFVRGRYAHWLRHTYPTVSLTVRGHAWPPATLSQPFCAAGGRAFSCSAQMSLSTRPPCQNLPPPGRAGAAKSFDAAALRNTRIRGDCLSCSLSCSLRLEPAPALAILARRRLDHSRTTAGPLYRQYLVATLSSRPTASVSTRPNIKVQMLVRRHMWKHAVSNQTSVLDAGGPRPCHGSFIVPRSQALNDSSILRHNELYRNK